MDASTQEQTNGAVITAQAGPQTGAVRRGAAPDDLVATAARKHFLLGWSIAELRGRLSTPSEVNRAGSVSAADRLSEQLWRGSQWRIAFDRVSSLHEELQIGGPPKDGRYDPGGQRPPYAYVQAGERDYADNGIIPAADVAALSEFTLRDAARRTINCLDLLSLDTDVMVNNDRLREDKQRLEETIKQPSTEGASDQSAQSGDHMKDKHTPIIRVRHDALVLLDLWTGYLREQLANKATDRDTTTMLVAYQCGQAMSSFSWNLTCRVLQAAETPGGTVQTDGAAAADPVELAFQQAFDARTVSYLQHELAILGSSLAEADSRVVKTIIRSLDIWQRAVDWLKGLASRNDPVLHGRKAFDRDLRIALVQQTSIWQSLVLGDEALEDFTTPEFTNNLRIQAAKLLATAITPEQIGDIERQVVDGTRDALVPLQTDIVAAIRGIGTDISAPLVSLRDNLVRQSLPIVLGIGAALVLLVVGSAVVLSVAGGSAWQTVINGVGGLVVAGLGLLHFRNVNQAQSDAADVVRSRIDPAVDTAGQKVQDTVTQVQQSIASVAQAAQNTVQETAKAAADIVQHVVSEAESASERAMQALDADLHDLENALAITYPLVDYVSSRTTQGSDARGLSPQDLASTFLRTVVWNKQDQDQEVLQVAYAAFGITGMAAVSEAAQKEDQGVVATAGGTG